jgi:ubiquinone/menaquinone biosynthesis C-methylase UbiE
MRSFVLLALCAALSAQVAQKANENYGTLEGRAKMVETLTAHSRDARQRPQELVASLEIKPGMTVADVGTGAGYMLPYLSKAVGQNGKVIAQDIHQDFLDAAKKTAADAKNVTYVLGNEKGTNLPDGAVDLILVLDVYHHLNFPEQMLADLRSKLKPGGRLAIVEYHKNEESMGRNGFALQHIRLGEEDAIKEIEANGFRLLSRREFTPRVQWLGFFERK